MSYKLFNMGSRLLAFYYILYLKKKKIKKNVEEKDFKQDGVVLCYSSYKNVCARAN